MSKLFSVVVLTEGFRETEFVVGGIPRTADDLVGYAPFDEFLEECEGEEGEIEVSVEAYLCGDGETVSASDEDILDIVRDIENILEQSDNIEDVAFTFLAKEV